MKQLSVNEHMTFLTNNFVCITPQHTQVYKQKKSEEGNSEV